MDSRETSGAPPQSQQPHPPSQQSSPPGMMVGHRANPSSMISNARFPFNSVMPAQQQPQVMASKPLDSFSSPPFDGSPPSLRPAGFNIETSSGKKKRGRPRKYAPDGNIALGLAPTPIHSEDQGDSSGMLSSESQAKKHRGRPPGSGKRQLNALGAAGVGFTPHVITVNAGEDVASKIMEFSQQGPRTVCILAANGSICNVTLRQPAPSAGTVSYEGRFEIISLSGSMSLTESDGSQTRTGGLSVSLAGSDGRVLGGGVAGMLLAATPVHVVVGSFIVNPKKSGSRLSVSGPSSTAAAATQQPQPQTLMFGTQVAAAAATASPPSQGGLSEESDENGDSPPNRGPPNHAPRSYGNANQPIHGMMMYPPSMGWANHHTMKMHPN